MLSGHQNNDYSPKTGYSKRAFSKDGRKFFKPYEGHLILSAVSHLQNTIKSGPWPIKELQYLSSEL